MANKESKPIYKSKLVIFVGVFVFVVFLYSFFSYLGSDKEVRATVANNEKVKEKISTDAGSDDATERYNEQLQQVIEQEVKDAQEKGKNYVVPVTNEEKSESLAPKIDDMPIQISGEAIDLYKKNAKNAEAEKRRLKERYENELKLREMEIKKATVELEKYKAQLQAERERRDFELQKIEQERQNTINDLNQKKINEHYTRVESIFSEYVNDYRFTAPPYAPTREILVFTNQEQSSQQAGQTVKQAQQQFIVGPNGQPIPVDNTNNANKPDLGIKAGDILYATNMVAINTDYSAQEAVVAKIIPSSPNSPLKDAKVFGQFTNSNESLVIQFNRLVLANGSEYRINAYAIDEKTSYTSVKSNIDKHQLERWGLLLAGTFLEGFAQSKVQEQQNKSMLVYDAAGNPIGETSSSAKKYTAEDHAIIAMGTVAQRSAGLIQENFMRPPTITLDRGATMGVLILEIE